ncbi:hypothetical protein ACIPVB_10465 [Microbacterium sp. NPDC090007]|uniref:hypothetical protein n=1 Tax=Microbacterium sp. NPDC090007 TaxID=3364204 RepID=UPI0038248000
MVMEAPLSRRGSQKAPTAPAVIPPVLSEIPWTRIDLDLYEVARAGVIVGYVEVVGAVFVALGGQRYDRAVEVSQHVTFHAAVDVLVRQTP